MSELTPAIAADVVAACQAGASDIADALSRALGGEFEATVGEAAAFDPQQLPAGVVGPGLAIVLQFGDVGALVLLPQSTGLLPDWYVQPDTTGKANLNTLAQELSMLVVPESLAASQFNAGGVESLAEVVARAELADDAQLVPLQLKSGESAGQLSLVWPAAKPLTAIPPVKDIDGAEPTNASASSKDEFDVSKLPPYKRSLFKIRVPVTVTLASQRKSVQEIVELGPGSIIKFDKTCDELLGLTVGGRTLAEGEAVKIGDKFGLRISNMVMPVERFASLPTTS